MLTFIAALIPLYFLWQIISQVFNAQDGDELLGSLIGIALVIWGLSWLFG
jgi:hypothetical protein|tara:strand:+ start:200 stop:349 length:150 start_codon:yes stop_codon:yes gene_type:complete